MWIEPEEAGAIVLRAVRNGDRYAFTHPNMLGDVESSFAGVRAAMTRYS